MINKYLLNKQINKTVNCTISETPEGFMNPVEERSMSAQGPYLRRAAPFQEPQLAHSPQVHQLGKQPHVTYFIFTKLPH